MALKVAILDTNALENKGSYGRLVGLLRALDATLPNHEVTVYHRYYDMAKKERIEDLKRYHADVEIKRIRGTMKRARWQPRLQRI